MKNWGSFGLTMGSLVGLLTVGLVALLLRPPSPPPVAPSNAIPPDITLFISEQSLSRMATEIVQRPVLVDFGANGQMKVTTRTLWQSLEPTVQAGLILELQGRDVISHLEWVRLGFLTIPAVWLPPRVATVTAMVGQAIEAQVPPGFILTDLLTESDGVIFQLKWVGP